MEIKWCVQNRPKNKCKNININKKIKEKHLFPFHYTCILTYLLIIQQFSSNLSEYRQGMKRGKETVVHTCLYIFTSDDWVW